MIKRLFLTLALMLAGPAFAAGTIPGFSLTQQFDSLGKPLSGCKFYTIQAGTTSTPQNAYQDTALTLPLPNPQTCDASGRLSQMFVADGLIKIRLTDKNGNQQVVADNILVIGPSGGGGGGGGTVDPTTVMATGDIKVSYGTSPLTGWVRANGRTIGSATSGATERANLDCQALFQYLWTADANLAVSGGRGASANADWTANKTIALPDSRGYSLAGLADMGNSASTIFSGATFTNGTSTTLGARLGASRRSLVTANLPPYTPIGSISINTISSVGIVTAGSAGTGGASQQFVATNITPTGTVTMNPQGGTSSAFDTISPFLLVTVFIKL